MDELERDIKVLQEWRDTCLTFSRAIAAQTSGNWREDSRVCSFYRELVDTADAADRALKRAHHDVAAQSESGQMEYGLARAFPRYVRLAERWQVGKADVVQVFGFDDADDEVPQSPIDDLIDTIDNAMVYLRKKDDQSKR